MTDTRLTILDALAAGPTTGPDLAARLGISRAAVWKHVETLREEGFGIESGSDGYALESVPEFGGTAVEFGLDAPFAVEYHETIGTTNERARNLAAAGASDVVVLADEQTAGRGRLDREWTAPSGGVSMSLVLRPSISPVRTPLLTLAAAAATTRAAREAGVDAGIKWPNDVLVPADASARRTTPAGGSVDEPKLAGILTEMEGEADRVSWVVVGIGVNANVESAALPEGATSILAEVGRIERRAFVQRVLETFDDLRGDPESILDAWRDHAITLDRRVRIETPTTTVVGDAVDVEPPGVLLVDTADGTVRVHAGDCEHLRPA